MKYYLIFIFILFLGICLNIFNISWFWFVIIALFPLWILILILIIICAVICAVIYVYVIVQLIKESYNYLKKQIKR
jgi:hypothetical protein